MFFESVYCTKLFYIVMICLSGYRPSQKSGCVRLAVMSSTGRAEPGQVLSGGRLLSGNRPGRGVKKHPYSSSADGRFFIDKGECVSIIGLNGLRGAGFHISLHT